MSFKLIAAAIIVGFFGVMSKASSRLFDDEDPDLDWHDNFAPPPKGIKNPTCSHINKTDIVQEVATVCEEIWTVCDDCFEVLNKRTDC